MAWFASALVLGFVLVFLMTRPSGRVIAKWNQPASLNYGSFDPYTLAVVEQGIDLYAIPWKRTHVLFVGHGPGNSYGHRVRFSFVARSRDMEDHIKAATVEWTTNGVKFAVPSGHEVFIPKKAFIGGR
jgi:hypothetical protein